MMLFCLLLFVHLLRLSFSLDHIIFVRVWMWFNIIHLFASAFLLLTLCCFTHPYKMIFVHILLDDTSDAFNLFLVSVITPLIVLEKFYFLKFIFFYEIFTQDNFFRFKFKNGSNNISLSRNAQKGPSLGLVVLCPRKMTKILS